jgi:hypothetical protein
MPNKEVQSAGLLEGAGFKCLKDGFFTRDVDEWNNHASEKDGNTTHITEDGAAPCAICKEEVTFEGLPFVKFDSIGRKNVTVLCDDCVGSTKPMKTSKKQGATKK